ncbi:unnamed protein product, partial [Amoebophrya sp. A25]|eukprot:GSA25T00014735001.1
MDLRKPAEYISTPIGKRKLRQTLDGYAPACLYFSSEPIGETQ